MSVSRVAKKAVYLIKHEGESKKQAFGMAYGMEREGRLNAQGEYIHKRRKK